MTNQRDWGWVYVVGTSSGGPVKIGYETRRGSRLPSIQTGNSERLRRLHDFPAYRDAERALHEAFAGSRRAGEWFSNREAIELTFMCLWEALEDKAQELAGDDPHWLPYRDEVHITAEEAASEARRCIEYIANNPDDEAA